jgi:hypothetical protein
VEGAARRHPQRCLDTTRVHAAREALSIWRSFVVRLCERALLLVAKEDDLDLEFAIRTRTTGPDHAVEQRIEESEQHDRAMQHRRLPGRRVT